MSSNKAEGVDASDDLDDLDDILDEFSEQKQPAASAPAARNANVDYNAAASSSSTSSTTTAPLPGLAPSTAPAKEGEETEEELNERFAKELAVGMEALMKGLGGPEGEALAGSAGPDVNAAGEGNENLFNEEEMMKQFEQMMADMGLGGLGGMEGLGGGLNNTGAEAARSTAANGSSSSTSNSTAPAPPANFQDAIKNTMSRLRESDASASSSTGAGADGMDLEKLMAALGSGGEGMEGEEGIAKMLESMMGELMSKDVLYDPLKELKDKYPGYLANPPTTLSSEDRARYEAQYRIVTQVIATFDDKKFDTGTEVEKTALKAKVQTLMNEMQDNGAPPPEIVGDLPPELENMPGLGGDENCTVM